MRMEKMLDSELCSIMWSILSAEVNLHRVNIEIIENYFLRM